MQFCSGVFNFAAPCIVLHVFYSVEIFYISSLGGSAVGQKYRRALKIAKCRPMLSDIE